MLFPFSFNRNRQIDYSQNKSLPEETKTVYALPPAALYIQNLLIGFGITVEVPSCYDKSWVPLYLPGYKRFIAIHIHGDAVLTKIKAKAFVKLNSKCKTPCPIDWIYPPTFYADCRKMMRKINPFC